MNQDFAVKATPGIARRIMQLAGIARVTIDDAIVELAKTGLIEQFPPQASARQRAAIQFLADAEYRGLLLCDDPLLGVKTALLAAIVSGIRPLTIMSDTDSGLATAGWMQDLTAHGFSPLRVPRGDYSHDPAYNAFLVNEEVALNKELLKHVRTGLLIIEGQCFQSEVAEGLCIEFPRTIAVVSRRGPAALRCSPFRYQRRRGDVWYHDIATMDVASRLLVDSNLASVLIVNNFILDELMKRGFVLPHPRKMALLLGVSTHLVDHKGEQET
jgi:hypothetical protein